MRMGFPGNQTWRDARTLRYRRQCFHGFPGCMLLPVLRSRSGRERVRETPRVRTGPRIPEDPEHELPVDSCVLTFAVALFRYFICLLCHVFFKDNPFSLYSFLISGSNGFNISFVFLFLRSMSRISVISRSK